MTGEKGKHYDNFKVMSQNNSMFKDRNMFKCVSVTEGSSCGGEWGWGRRAGMEVGELGKARSCRLWRPWE